MKITGKRHYRFHPETKTLEINLPIQLIRKSGRTTIHVPDDQPISTLSTSNTTLMRALTQAHIWLQQLEKGEFNDVSALALHCNKNRSYISRITRLTMLSPAIQERIMTGQPLGSRPQAEQKVLADFMDGFPMLWEEQEAWLDD